MSSATGCCAIWDVGSIPVHWGVRDSHIHQKIQIKVSMPCTRLIWVATLRLVAPIPSLNKRVVSQLSYWAKNIQKLWNNPLTMPKRCETSATMLASQVDVTYMHNRLSHRLTLLLQIGTVKAPCDEISHEMLANARAKDCNNTNQGFFFMYAWPQPVPKRYLKSIFGPLWGPNLPLKCPFCPFLIPSTIPILLT